MAAESAVAEAEYLLQPLPPDSCNVGEDWQPLPEWPLGGSRGRRRCRTETEAAYESQLKPIFRLLYQY